MRDTDKLLIGIVAGVILLVILAFVIVLGSPEPTYQEEDAPEGVAHNYLLALEQGAHPRAYGYLSPTLPGYPNDAGTFSVDIERNRWAFRLDSDVSLSIASSIINGDRATVTVRESRSRQGGLFDSNISTSTFTMALLRSGDTWQITTSGAYWNRCWEHENGC